MPSDNDYFVRDLPYEELRPKVKNLIIMRDAFFNSKPALVEFSLDIDVFLRDCHACKNSLNEIGKTKQIAIIDILITEAKIKNVASLYNLVSKYAQYNHIQKPLLQLLTFYRKRLRHCEETIQNRDRSKPRGLQQL